MILIGLTDEQKRKEIVRYVQANNIQSVIVFSDEHFFMDLPDLDIPIRQIGYMDTIMYKTFYPLLEEIREGHLLVMNEMMREKNRSCLTYNCIAKYTNQTQHRIVFEFLPMIDEPKDILILDDFDRSQAHKGLTLEEVGYDDIDIRCVRHDYVLDPIDVALPVGAQRKYADERERLFDTLDSKDPDTIPRNLHIWTGQFKKPYIVPDLQYVARNSRFRMQNVTPYKSVVEGQYTMIDFQHSQKEINDFLRRSKQTNLPYLSTGFPIDKYYITTFNDWVRRLEQIYAETGVYSDNG